MSWSGSLRSRDDSSESSSISGTVQQKEMSAVRIDTKEFVYSVTFLVDGKHVVTGGREGKIRCWRAEDGTEVGISMNAGSHINDISASRDGKWIVGATSGGEVAVWNADSHEKVTEFKAHNQHVHGVDVSLDGTRIATASADKTACVWSLSTCQRLLGPLSPRGNGPIYAAIFAPDGRLIATASNEPYVRIYDAQNGSPLLTALIQASAVKNESLAWTSDSKQLFVQCRDGNIRCLDASTGETCFQWSIHGHGFGCIVLASDDGFIVVSAGHSVSFWDTKTQKQIGSAISHTGSVSSISISRHDDVVIAGGKTVTVRSLCDILPSSYLQISREHVEEEKYDPEVTVESPVAQESLEDRITRLEGTNQELNDQLLDCQKTIKSLRKKTTDLEEHLDTQHAYIQRIDRVFRAHEQKLKCESLYGKGRVIDAAYTLLEITNSMGEEVRANSFIMDWLAEFNCQCISVLERIGDDASTAEKQDEADHAYSTALLLCPPTPETLLRKWASKVLARSSPNEALSAAVKFKLPSLVICRTICEVLEMDSRVADAAQFFQENITEIETASTDEREWFTSFKSRCTKTLEQRGDAAMDSGSYNDAIIHYGLALTLERFGPSSMDLLIKRSKARAGMGSWQESLEDADEAIELDLSSPRGYERRHAALLGARRYDEAIVAYNDMLFKLEQSPDSMTRGLRGHYVNPSETVEAIREVVHRTQRDAPLVLINTETGCLHGKHGRSEEFEGDAAFKELVASMTTTIKHSRINQTVHEYFRYGTLSHTWEGAEPLFQDVVKRSIHDLPESLTVFKLTMFCVTIRDAGLRWAWSDTCCINKLDPAVLQESLTSMFKWYHHSALTIVHLKGVLSDSDLRRALEKSLWNTRAWTLQEFFASQVIRFYTQDWMPYLPQESEHNHKDSTAIMDEMAGASSVVAQVLLSLRSGSRNVRQKLCLAAARVATRQEDIAYSLFGIFDVVSIQANYGEGQERALGRLLQEVLTRSGDVTILAWTGKKSEYNSCLPAEISVYREPVSNYVPSMIEEDRMDKLVTELRKSFNVDSVVTLYNQVFPLKRLSLSGGNSPSVYRAVTSALRNVEIKVKEDMPKAANLVLVHPWLQCLLDPAASLHSSSLDDEDEQLSSADEGGLDGDPEIPSPVSSDNTPSLDGPTMALRLFARLRQPFGALLLTRVSYNEYRRVASDQIIKAQLMESISPQFLAKNIRTLDVL